jgi:hypothetical protein
VARLGPIRSLKAQAVHAETQVMRYQRLVLENSELAFTLPLHPRLTVIGGVGRGEREGLIGELLGALTGSRRGVRLEIADDNGRRLVVDRAETAGGDRVTDADSGRDVTAEFRAADGRVDLLTAIGVPTEDGHRLSRVTSFDLTSGMDTNATVARLALLDQRRMWAAAEAAASTDAALRNEAEAAGASADDAPLIEAVEEHHAAFESAQARHESFRHNAIFIGGASALGAIPAALLNRWTAIPFLAVALLTTLLSIRFRRKMRKAHRREQAALDAAGADTYIAFHIQRMNKVLDNENNRERLAEAAAAHRAAAAAWRSLVGDVSPSWALGMRQRIEAAAASAGRAAASAGREAPNYDPAEMAEALIARIAELRHAGGRGESLPLLLDDPFGDMTTVVKRWLLDLVGRSAGSPQIVVLTGDPDVTAWARSEAANGAELAVIEPSTADVS